MAHLLFEVCAAGHAGLPSMPHMLQGVDAQHKLAEYGMDTPDEPTTIWTSSLAEGRLVVRQSDGLRCCVKMVDKSKCRTLRAAQSANREIKIVSRLQHPAVLPLLECWHSANHVAQVFHFYPTDLFSFTSPYGGGMPEE